MYLGNRFDDERPAKRLRRRHPRFAVQCRARILIGKRHYAGYVHDISEGGAKLRTVSSIRKLGEVMLRLPDLPPMKCRLTWTGDYHAGVLFEFPLTKAELRKWVEGRTSAVQLNNGPEPECELLEILTEKPVT